MAPADGAPRSPGLATLDLADRLSWWQRLIEPAASIQEIGERRLARLLASVLLCLILMGLVANVLAILVGTGISLLSIVGKALIVIAYVLSRTRHVLAATLLAAACMLVLSVLSAYDVASGDPLEAVIGTYWAFLSIIIGSIYLSVRAMCVLTIVMGVSVLAVLLAIPAATPNTIVTVELFLLLSATLVITVTQHQRLVERDRLALIEKRGSELARLNRSMETMLYVISHDLKEPLRAIQSFSQLISSQYTDKLDDRGRDFLARVVRGAERMRVLLDDVLKLSRAQRIEPPGTTVEGDEIVRVALARLGSRIAETKATVEVAPNLPNLPVDKAWGVVAMYNLLDNALKHALDGVPPRIDVAAYDGPAGVGLVVRDRGPGVAPEYSEKIFELFQRAVGREVPGTGAGLAIVRQIAERHGGNAWVEPRAGGGSEFYITFQGQAGTIGSAAGKRGAAT